MADEKDTLDKPVIFEMSKNVCNLKECSRKLSMIEAMMKCKCQYIFCTKHRLASSHNCTYNYKLDNQKQLENTMIKVIADKIQPI